MAGDQMIQIKAHEGTKTAWQTVASGAKQSCDGKILTWNSKATTEEACKQSCENWGTVQTNANSNRPCGAAYFFQKPDGSRLCRLYETCEKCKAQAFVGITWTRSDQVCSTKCAKSDCRRVDGRKTKANFAEITCATPVCTKDECCDWLPGKEPTTTTTTTTTTTAAPTTTTEGRHVPGGSGKFMTQNAMNGCIDGYAPRVVSYEQCKAGVYNDWDGKWHRFNHISHRQEPQCANAEWPSKGCFLWGNYLYYSNCPESRSGHRDYMVVCEILEDAPW